MAGGRLREFTSDLANLEDGVRKEQRSNFLEIGKLLTEILDNELYVLRGYKSFVKYIDDEPVFRFTGKHAIRLVRTYRFINSLPRGVSVPTSERQVRPLIKLGFEDARDVWLEAQRVTKEDGKPVTGELVAELVGELNVAKGFQESANVRKTRPHTRPRRWSQDSDTSRTEDETWLEDRVEETPRWETDNTQSAVLLLAEFERLRERVKDLPLQQRERLLMEWRDSVDEDLNIMESSYGSGGPCERKRKLSVEPDTPTSYARVRSLVQEASSDFVFAVRKKRSRVCRSKRIWSVPAYLNVKHPEPQLCSITGSSNICCHEAGGNVLDIQGTCDLTYLTSFGRRQDSESQAMTHSFVVPFLPIPAK